MSERLWPRLWHLQFSHEVVGGVDLRLLSDSAHRALIELVGACGAGLVWTYTEPKDGSLPDDDAVLARIVGFDLKKWKSIRPEIERFFKIMRGRWHLDRDWIAVAEGTTRFAIPLATRETVLAREGRMCAYCGTTDGPFDFDHILPISKGGSNSASNLTLACAMCNRSKGGRTLLEWMGAR